MVTFTALSMISMPIRTAMALRLAIAPYSPMQKRIAPSTRKWFKVNIRLVLPADHDCAYDGYQQHDRRDFEGQHVAVATRAIEELADVDDVVGWNGAGRARAVTRADAGARRGELPQRDGEDDGRPDHYADDGGQRPLPV